MNRVILHGAHGERFEYGCDACVVALCDEHAPYVIRVEKAPPVFLRSGVELAVNCPQCGMQVA